MKVGGGGIQAFNVDRKVCESQASRDDQKVGWGGQASRKQGIKLN